MAGLAIIVVLLASYPYLSSFHEKNDDSAGQTLQPNKDPNELYLLDKASVYIRDIDAFKDKVNEVSEKLQIPSDWLMAVMHSESRFDASVENKKGSGATGLIQLMPHTCTDFDITIEQLRNLNHVDQLDYVYDYLNTVREQRGISYHSLTDLYLAILYPRALVNNHPNYVLYENPSIAYKMNNGLDENQDKRVTISDIDMRMRRVYSTAFHVPPQSIDEPYQVGASPQIASFVKLSFMEALLFILLIFVITFQFYTFKVTTRKQIACPK